MSLLRHNPSRDAIEPDVCEALDLLGISYVRLSQAGVPDLLIWHREQYFLIELKRRGGKRTKAQIRFHARWRGPIHICCSVNVVLDVINPSVIVSRGCK